MSGAELKRQIEVELRRLAQAVDELRTIEAALNENPSAVVERTAAGALLAQFYAGVERIMKRLLRFHGVEPPRGEQSHLELIELFRATPPEHSPTVPDLIDDELAAMLAPYRRFRHVVFHGYGFELDWNRMREGVRNVETVYDMLRRRIEGHLRTLSG